MKTLRRYFVVFALLLPIISLAQPKADEMKGMDMDKKPSVAAQTTHTATGTVKKIDTNAGTVVLDHQPVKSLNWPAMTMSFKVPEKSLFDKLAQGKTVEFSFAQVGKDYVITGVK